VIGCSGLVIFGMRNRLGRRRIRSCSMRCAATPTQPPVPPTDHGQSQEEVIFPIIPPRHDDEPLPTIDGTFRDLSHTDDSLRMSIVELYHRLQNLSDYPHAPSLARRYFLASIVKAVREATAEPASSSSILSLPTRFNAMALEHWLKAETEQTTGRLGEYVKRRKAGGGREMFRDREDAVRWCRESAVVKYVDGSWLQGTFRCTSGTNLAVNDVLSVLNGLSSGSGGSRRVKEGVKAERRAARTSWQVLSEELGDGDLERSHVAAYQSLMDSLSSQDRSGPAPRGYQRRFVSWLAGPDGDSDQPDKQPWIAALLQLTITSSPDEFLPEILGFNVSYEGLPLHLLITTKELRELAIDPYYFVVSPAIHRLQGSI